MTSKGTWKMYENYLQVKRYKNSSPPSTNALQGVVSIEGKDVEAFANDIKNLFQNSFLSDEQAKELVESSLEKVITA